LNNLNSIVVSKPKILLTGHTGFKGYWLVHLLTQLELEVVGVSLSDPTVDSLIPNSRSGLIREYFVDVRDSNSLKTVFEREKPEVVIHFAAESLVQACLQNPSNAFSVNVLGTLTILEIGINSPSVKAIAITTTDKVYKNDNSGISFTEDAPLQGKDPYSGSKVAQENVIFSFGDQALMSGKKLITLRAGNVIGGADISPSRLLPDFIRSMATESTLKIRNPDSTRPWQHVLDCLYGYILAIQHGLIQGKSEIFNFGPTERSLSVSEVLSIADRYSSTPVNTSFETPNFYEAPTLNLDSTKSRKLLGWSPRYSQEESVGSTIEWWNSVLTGKKASEVTELEVSDYLLKATRGA